MPHDRRNAFTPHVAAGIGIMLLGLVLTLDRLGLVEARALMRFWPLLLILFGASLVAQAWRPSSATGTDPGPPAVSPALVFLVVIAIVLGTQAQRLGETAGPGRPSSVRVFSIMGHGERASAPRVLRGGEMTSVMGQALLDLRQAQLAPGEEAVVDVFALMGRAVLRVPPGWAVDVRAATVMGAVDDRRPRAARPAASPASGPLDPEPPLEGTTPVPGAAPPPRVVLRGLILMGGLTIRP